MKHIFNKIYFFMKKILVLTDKNKKSFLFRMAEKFFLTESIECESGVEAEKIIRLETPDYILLDVIKPVNGDDMMNMLSHIDESSRLRVSIFYIGYRKKELFKYKPQTNNKHFHRAAG